MIGRSPGQAGGGIFMRMRVIGIGIAVLAFLGGAAAADEAHWGYEGEHGPEHWGAMAPENAACAVGAQQSPIDIKGAVKAELPALKVNWARADAMILNNGHTIQVDMPAGSSLSRGDAVYELLQFHFHTHSEHLIDGEPSPMEVHFVHRNAATGGLGVLGVMMEEGGDNAAFAGLARAFPDAAGTGAAITIDPNGLLPASLDHWVYAGSLTTPPCSEIVDWMVARMPIKVAPGDMAKFRALFPMNARPALPVNGRPIRSSF